MLHFEFTCSPTEEGQGKEEEGEGEDWRERG